MFSCVILWVPTKLQYILKNIHVFADLLTSFMHLLPSGLLAQASLYHLGHPNCFLSLGLEIPGCLCSFQSLSPVEEIAILPLTPNLVYKRLLSLDLLLLLVNQEEYYLFNGPCCFWFLGLAGHFHTIFFFHENFLFLKRFM